MKSNRNSKIRVNENYWYCNMKTKKKTILEINAKIVLGQNPTQKT